jgi:hypothetical protein
VSSNRDQQPPGVLGTSGRRLWDSVTSLYGLSPAELELLWQAAQVVDVIDALSEVVWSGNAKVKGSAGQIKAHPLLAAVNDQRRLLDGLLRSLNLPLPSEETGRRRSPAAQAAAQARWNQEQRERRIGSVAAQ